MHEDHTDLPPPFDRRRAGVLLHPTSLPGPGAQGDLGRDAYRFVDWLRQAGITVWQMLPLGPTHADRSPYQSLSAHAGNIELLSYGELQRDGLLRGDELQPERLATGEHRAALLSKAWSHFPTRASTELKQALDQFREEAADWLEDYLLFIALRERFGQSSWVDWPQPLRDRDAKAIAAAQRELKPFIDQQRFAQFLFYRQWQVLRRYANERNVLLFGDLPIFVSHDSSDVWAQRELFDLDERGRPRNVAGVPPDYFSATGQRWGNPLYRWPLMRENRFEWWVERLRGQLKLYDFVRIDHFRGFEAFWEIPASEPTAINGHWVKAPGRELFERLRAELGNLPVVAEDLGIITPEVEQLRRDFRMPGMKILQFAFDGSPDNPYLPQHHEPLSITYTGTHDNDTTLGWFRQLDDATRGRLMDYLNHPGDPMPWPLIHVAFNSSSQMAVVPLQDLLMLNEQHRMNRPGTVEGNWGWRFGWDWIPDHLAGDIRRLVEQYRRRVD